MRLARTPSRGADLQRTYIYVFRHTALQRFSRASPSLRLSRLPISTKRGTQRLRAERARWRPRAERAISDGLERGT